jgi:hypothetical protein
MEGNRDTKEIQGRKNKLFFPSCLTDDVLDVMEILGVTMKTVGAVRAWSSESVQG